MKVGPQRAAALRERLSRGGEAWGTWCEHVAAFMPAHAVCSPHSPDRWTWSTPAGVWTLDLGRPQEVAHGGIRVWRGADGAPGSPSPWQWRFEDPDPEHIRAFLVLVGALDWDVPDA